MHDPIERKMYEFLVSQNVDSDRAAEAARVCSWAVEKRAVGGALAGVIVATATGQFELELLLMVAGAGIGAYSAYQSASCQEVHDAVDQVINRAFEFNP